MVTTHIDFGVIVWLLFMAAIVFYVVHAERLDRTRRSRIQRFLFSADFIQCSLPEDLPLRSLDERLAGGRVVACYSGTYAGCRAVVADFRIGAGRGSYPRQTMDVEAIEGYLACFT